MDIELLIYVLVLGVGGYAAGRLLTVDTVLNPVRSPILEAIRGRDTRPPQLQELAAEGYDLAMPAHGTTGVRGYVIDGITCPSCMAWWCIVAAHFGLGLMRAPWRFDVLILFASWGIAGALVRKVG